LGAAPVAGAAPIISLMPYFSFTQFHIGPITFQTWGTLLWLAFLVGYWIFLRGAKREGVKEKEIFLLVLWVFGGALLGSRFLYFLQFSAGGFAFHGGLLGGMLAGWLYAGKNKLNFGRLADLAAPALALGIFIGRIGCSLINDHPGVLTDLPWAIEWPDGALRHPVAEYLALNALIMFFVLWRIRFFVKKRGQLFIIFLVWYNVARFFLDFTRAADTELIYYNLMISQWMSLLILAGVSAFLFYSALVKPTGIDRF